MSRADERFEAFTKAIRSGIPLDTATLFDGLDRIERLELEDLIDGFLSSPDRAPTDLDSFEETRQKDATLDRLGRSLEGVSGLWPSTLPRLRDQAKLGRDEIASRLAGELGNPAGSEKIKAYYHGMEWGELPAEGVNEKVIESLARILEADVDELRDAGRFGGGRPLEGFDAALQEGSGAGPDQSRYEVFSRAVGPDQVSSMTGPPASPGTEPHQPDADDWDETDRLFRGG